MQNYRQYSSPLLVVPKKAWKDGENKRGVVVDYRKLNSTTIGSVYSVPRIDNIWDQQGHTRKITTIDLASAYNKVAISPKSRQNKGSNTKYNQY